MIVTNMKVYSRDELFNQIKIFLSENIAKDREFIIDDIKFECIFNWVGNGSIGHKILASKDYEITLKIKGQ